MPLAVGLNFDFFGLYTDLNPEFYWGGEQAAWWGPMAIAVICGLSFATFLTLLLVPVMYSLFDDFDRWARRVFVTGERAAVPAVPVAATAAPVAPVVPVVPVVPVAAPSAPPPPAATAAAPDETPVGPQGVIATARPRMRD